MTCEQIAELLPEYFHKALSPASSQLVEQHLRGCAACEGQVALWNQMGNLADEVPSPALRKRFEAMAAVYQEGRWEHDHLKAERPSAAGWFANLFRMPAFQGAAAVLLVAIGFGVGQLSKRTPDTSVEFAQLHKEVSSMRQLLVITMLQQTSASGRLQGVSYSYQLAQADPEIISALIQSLKSDSSVDVRLAALDSLRRYEQDQRVRQGLTDALGPKQSPLVQIALIDALVEMRDREALNKFQELEQTPNVNPAVKERARSGIATLSKG
jgi:hypothetical protein